MKIALVGNQNSGKTTLFNLLTGSNQKVGNWPGVTIEQKIGKIKNTSHELIDLPGIYSLSPYTVEEEVSRKFIIEEKLDVIINIVDATSIERSLYLTTQLLELDAKVIIALNMSDLLEKKGLLLDVKKLSEKLHTPIVVISALKETGIDELIKEIDNIDLSKKNDLMLYENDIETSITKISSCLYMANQRFIAVKILENDPIYVNMNSEEVKQERLFLEEKYGFDIEQIIADGRYRFIVKLREECVVRTKEEKETITDKLDKIFLNKYAAIPIFACIMFLIYFLSVGIIGSATVDLVGGTIDNLNESIRTLLEDAGALNWLISLICDGIISGVGAVLGFVPQLIILFLCIALLETTGYMSRISFFFDLFFRKIGLSGKSLVPFIVGAGCSVPGIMTARTVEDEQERKITVICTPFIPCSAKLPIIALFVGHFFNNNGFITFGLYVFSIIIIIITALIMKKFFYKRINSSFISELPEYKLPSIKYIARDVFDKTWSFIKRAGTVILLCSVLIWFLSSFSWNFWEGMVSNIDDSILASVGKLFSWIFYPMLGANSWEATVSAVQGLVAKELVVSSMNILAGLAEESVDYGVLFGSSGIFGFFTPASALAYCVFCLFSAPCFGAIGAMKKELGSTKRMLGAVMFQTVLAYILACIVFGIGTLIINLG